MAGIDFQGRLAAAVACGILAETEAAPWWDWPESGTLEGVYVETAEEADDVSVTNSAGDRAWVQAKLRLNLGKTSSSDLARALGQLVRQSFSAQRDGKPLTRRDRLVLAVGPSSSSRITDELPRLLEKIRGLPADAPLSAATGTNNEEEVLKVVTGHITEAWKAEAGSEPTEGELRELMSHVRVSRHDLGDGGTNTLIAQEQLRRTALVEPAQAGQAWDSLVSAATHFGAVQTGADRQRLQELLENRGLELRAAPSYREDIERLRAYSDTIVDRLKPLSHISLPGEEVVKISRAVPDELIAAAEKESLLVTGNPGVGKSAGLYELVRELKTKGRDVVLLAADALSAGSLGELRDEIRLDHEVVDVLTNWPGTEKALIVVDALDAARGENTQAMLLDLIPAVSVTAPRWLVTASIRRFDLRYTQKLKDLFLVDGDSPVADDYVSPEFPSLRHFVVPVLSDEELAQLESLAPALHVVVADAPSDLRELARVPFNLRLLAELVSLDVSRAELEPITTQVQLLDKYWEHRVLGSDSDGDAKEEVLRDAVNAMIETRALQIDRDTVANAVAADPLNSLLSDHVLTEREEPGGHIERNVLRFSHHVLFDYSVDRLLLRGTEDRVPDAVATRPDLLLVVRPSFDLHFRHLWQIDPTRRRFWDLALALASREEVPQIGKIIGPTIATELVIETRDLDPLLAALTSDDDAQRGASEEVLRHLIGALVGRDTELNELGEKRLTAWSLFAAALAAADLRLETIFPLRQLLWSLVEAVELDANQRAFVGSAARQLLRFAIVT
ncbi:MAG: hypothetical protein U0R24_00530 [Solirubrobacterales bacterium]